MQEKLMKLGLNQTEVEVYLALLENNRLTPANISRVTNINRTTIYAAASELLKKGIIEEDLSGKTKYFVVTSPESLANYTNKKIQEVREEERLIQQLLPELELVPKAKNFSVPKIQFVNKLDIEDFLYKKTPIWEQSMIDTKETTCWGFQDHEFTQHESYKKWILWYWKNIRPEIDLKLFTNESKIEQEMAKEKIERRMLKLWEGQPFTSTQWIFGEYIVSIVTREKNHYLVQIRDAVLAESMRNLAKKLWEKS